MQKHAHFELCYEYFMPWRAALPKVPGFETKELLLTVKTLTFLHMGGETLLFTA